MVCLVIEWNSNNNYSCPDFCHKALRIRSVDSIARLGNCLVLMNKKSFGRKQLIKE